MIGDNFFFLNSVDSTNNYAMGRVHAGLAKHGFVYQAGEQTAGKGQRGKLWETEAGQNITLSIVLDTKTMNFSTPFPLSACIALSIADLLLEKVKSDLKIKWPNDIYWRDRKAGGILIENILQGIEWKYAIAGIGLNINQVNFPPELINPVSLRQVTGKIWNIRLLAKELCNCIERRWQQLLADPEKLVTAYNNYLYKRDEKVHLKKNNIKFETVIREVNKAGELITQNAGIQLFKSGEIQWMI